MERELERDNNRMLVVLLANIFFQITILLSIFYLYNMANAANPIMTTPTTTMPFTSPVSAIVAALSVVIMLVLDIVLFLQYINQLKRLAVEKEIELMAQMSDAFFEGIETGDSFIKRQRIINHEINGQLAFLYGLIQSGEKKQALAAASELSNFIDYSQIRDFSELEYTNIMLNYKYILAGEYKTAFSCEKINPIFSETDVCFALSIFIDAMIRKMPKSIDLSSEVCGEAKQVYILTTDCVAEGLLNSEDSASLNVLSLSCPLKWEITPKDGGVSVRIEFERE